VPISGSPWSGDHGGIKGDPRVGAAPDDKVRVTPSGDVWVQRPNGDWENVGNAGDMTGSGNPSGRKGKDRDKEREDRRTGRDRKRNWDCD
jgi:hypothetical protein